jgi:hypothetical protein
MILPKNSQKNEPPLLVNFTPLLPTLVLLSKERMGIEKKNLFEAETDLYRRGLLFGAGAAVLTGAVLSSLPHNRARIASLPREGLTPDRFRMYGSEYGIHPNAAAFWNRYSEAVIFHERTRALFGADLNDNGTPSFQTNDMVSALQRAQPNAESVSGIVIDPRTQRRAVTEKAMRTAKSTTLTWIEETEEPTTLFISAHGARSADGTINTISLGGAPNPDSTHTYVFMHPDELAGAYAHRYRSMRMRLQARSRPDILAFINCGSGDLGSEFLTSLQTIEHDQEPYRFRRFFKPTIPFTFAAGTGGEITYINQLFRRMTEYTTVGQLEPHMDFVGSEVSNSNPMVWAPDHETGEPVIIGSHETDTRFA